MTEQEFRDALKRQVGQTGLSSDRQLKVLARMKGAEPKVRTWNKMKVSLVIVLVVMMTMGPAVAMEIVNYVNWDGETVEYTPPAYETLETEEDPLRDPIVDELIAEKKVGEILSIRIGNQQRNGDVGTGNERILRSMEEFEQLAGKGTLLPTPINIPDGFELIHGYCFFATEPGARYRLVAQEYYEYGIEVKRFACDSDQLFMCSYFLRFENAQGEFLNMSVRLMQSPEKVLPARGGTVSIVQIEGMEQSIYFEKEEYNQVWAYRMLEKPVLCQLLGIWPDEIVVMEEKRELKSLDIQFNSSVLTLNEMLAVCGLTAE